MKCICITNTYKCLQLVNIESSGLVFDLFIKRTLLEFSVANRYNTNIKYISDKAWCGRKCIDPESLSEQDTDFSVNAFTKEFQKTLKRTRDVIKMTSGDICCQILAIENRQAVHYAMPLRCMIYDGLVYLNQVTDLTARNRETGTLDIYGEIILRELENQKEEIDMCEKVREVLEETKSEGMGEAREMKQGNGTG